MNKPLISVVVGVVCLLGSSLSAKIGVPDETGLHGTVITFAIGDRVARVVEPQAGRRTFPTRWVWFMGGDFMNPGFDNEIIANELLDQGYVVAWLGIGVGCGSPASMRFLEAFYDRAIADFGLDPKARLLAQSNGGLAAYGFAARHPDRVDRIAGVYPAVDWRSWPGLDNLPSTPPADIKFTEEELARENEINPINTLAPIAAGGVKIFHMHGDIDQIVDLTANSIATVNRYRALGGDAELEIVQGLGHVAKGFYRPSIARFLTGGAAPGLRRETGPVTFWRR